MVLMMWMFMVIAALMTLMVWTIPTRMMMESSPCS